MLKTLLCLSFFLYCIPIHSDTFFFDLDRHPSFWLQYQGENDVIRYQNNSKLEWEWAMDLLANHHFKGCEKVLDIGCGDGKVTSYLSTLLPKGSILGIDNSRSMIEYASKNYPYENYSNLKFLQADAISFSFYQKYDVITSFCCMHWISDQEIVLKNIRRHLKPGGIALLVMPAKSSSSMAQRIGKITSSEKWKGYFKDFANSRRYYNAAEYILLIKKANLIPIRVEDKIGATVFENKHSLKNWLSSVSNYVMYLPEELREDFIEDILQDILIFNPPDAQGRIKLHLTKTEVIAKKPLE